ncbi:MAG TPA: hypothetical protein VJZ76_21025 [Thermoanaerobaculia bacterium]|nr:hypothetical protein [Thermoanaerobaculia bacterium]
MSFVIATFVPATSDMSSVKPLSDRTTWPAAILSRVTAPAASIEFVTPPVAICSVMSPFVPPPVSPGPAITERIVPKRNAISNPVESPLLFEISDPASTMWPLPPACTASTLPCRIVVGTSAPTLIRRCS